MGLLLYKSNEMFSSTELIRKSKMIFDKILGRKIEKAIILRDGKPSFLLMEFSKYEKIMAEYEELKEYVESLDDDNQTKVKKSKKKKTQEDTKLKAELEEEAKNLSMDGGDYSDGKEKNTQDENKAEKEQVVVESSENTIKPMIKELSEEEEIQKAYANIESMNLDDSTKQQAKEKIRLKIKEAREERIKLANEQEQKLQELDELEDQIQQEKLKKEQELEEFWD